MDKQINLKNSKAGIIKFGAYEHMKAFYEKGEMFFNTFLYFKKLEQNGDGRADKNEYCSAHYSGEYLKKYITLEIKEQDSDKTIGVLNGKNGLKDLTLDLGNDKEFTHLYSMSYIDLNWTIKNDLVMSPENFAPGKDFAVLIYDMNTFIEKVTTKLNEQNFNYAIKPIEYVNKKSYSGKMGPFRKFDDFSYQNEFRIVVNFNTVEHPQIIHIGSLKGIAEEPVNAYNFYNSDTRITYKTSLGELKSIQITNKHFFENYDLIS